jgi:Flp pilus assembly protein TadD
MANRARLTIVIVSLALSLAACASSSQMPPAAEQVHPD